MALFFFFFLIALHTGCPSIFQCIILHSTLLFYLPISTARLWTLSGQKQWFLFLPQTTALCPGPITFSTNVWWRNGWINGVFQGMWVPRAEIVQFFFITSVQGTMIGIKSLQDGSSGWIENLTLSFLATNSNTKEWEQSPGWERSRSPSLLCSSFSKIIACLGI